MKIFLRSIYILLAILLFIYVSFPFFTFPNPPDGFVKSSEPADLEDINRRGYYTNLTRSEIIAHYENEFKRISKLPHIRLNYPPEEAQEKIRDQTRSSYLEELVHPLRDSVYISGLEAEKVPYELNYDEKVWNQKVIIKYIPSELWIRFFLSSLILASIYLLVREYQYAAK